MSDTTERMQEVARAVAVILPPGTGFVVFAFDLSTPENPVYGRLEYVSNAKRESVIETLKQFIAKNENPDDWGKHLT